MSFFHVCVIIIFFKVKGWRRDQRCSNGASSGAVWRRHRAKKPYGVCYATASGTQRILRGSLRVSSQNKIQGKNICGPNLVGFDP